MIANDDDDDRGDGDGDGGGGGASTPGGDAPGKPAAKPAAIAGSTRRDGRSRRALFPRLAELEADAGDCDSEYRWGEIMTELPQWDKKNDINVSF